MKCMLYPFKKDKLPLISKQILKNGENVRPIAIFLQPNRNNYSSFQHLNYAPRALRKVMEIIFAYFEHK